MNAETLKENILSGALDMRFAKLYGSDETVLAAQRVRYAALIDEFASRYGKERDIALFSVPGRSELSGNHTDHNHGCVIAGSVDLDIIAVAAKNDDSIIRIKSEGFPEDVVNIDTYNTPDEGRFGKSDALIAGVADGFRNRGFAVGGYDACTTSSVLKGSGLSSSAAFENMAGLLLSHFYNSGSVDFVTLAQISQYSENKFFGKPCGLMDQVACAAGGIVSIDFADTSAPIVEKVDFDLTDAGYCLCIVNTGGNHADLTPDYAAVPAEMKAVAAELGKSVLRETDRGSLIKAIPALREKVGDRAILRALHFFAENDRVAEQKSALKSGDIEKYFEGVLASGKSSFCYLQNVYTTANVAEQGLSLALNLCESYLSNLDAPTAWRVHGGGFAGTVQAYVPISAADGFVNLLESVFGEGSCYLLHIRLSGAVRVF